MIPIIMFQVWYSTKRITGVFQWKWERSQIAGSFVPLHLEEMPDRQITSQHGQRHSEWGSALEKHDVCLWKCRCSVGWPVGERLGIGLEEMVMAEENRPPICSFLLQNHFLYPNFEMFFNYLPLTNGQMETKREDIRIEKWAWHSTKRTSAHIVSRHYVEDSL